MEQKQIAKTLASFAPAYQNAILKIDQNENWKKQFDENDENDPKANYIALEFFLDHFAYERRVKVEAYPAIAKRTLKAVFKDRLENIQLIQTDAKQVWERYEQIAAEEFELERNKLNWRLNPMFSDGGVLTKMANAENKGILNIANYVKALIEDEKTSKAYSFIISIRGIGPKIASFYLRDIAYLGKIDEKEIKEPFYLQPLDTWLNQALSIMKKEKVNLKTNKERQDAQKMIVKLCKQADCSPIAFNQGAWFAGSQIAGERSKFKEIALGDTKIVEDYVEKQRHYFSEIEKALDRN